MITVNPFQGLLNQRVCDAADFDGTNDYMTRGAGLTGAADSKSGIFSCWVRLDSGTGGQRLYEAPSSAFRCIRNATAQFVVDARNTAGTAILALTSNASYSASATWLHLLASWDLATEVGHFYIADVSDVASSTLTNDTIDYTVTDLGIGALISGSGKLEGCMAEFYLAPGQYLDLSIATNRRKFISSSGKPVHLGTDGSLPTGTAPLVYLHLDDSEAVANFATNRGTGGNFTITGTLETASTSPSD